MESMNISLPEELRGFVTEQVQAGYGSTSEYIRELIRADREKQRQVAFEQTLLEQLAAGNGRELSDADWQAVRDRIASRRGASGRKTP